MLLAKKEGGREEGRQEERKQGRKERRKRREKIRIKETQCLTSWKCRAEVSKYQ